jgi:hypothetical protein
MSSRSTHQYESVMVMSDDLRGSNTSLEIISKFNKIKSYVFFFF